MKIIVGAFFLLSCGGSSNIGKSYNGSHVAPEIELSLSDTCNSLDVFISDNDTYNYTEDSQYGVGDDDLFSVAEFIIYKVNKGRSTDVSNLLSDYNLTTSLSLSLENENVDTFDIIIKFPGLNDLKIDTIGLISNVTIFNGNRKSPALWSKSGKVKMVGLLHNKVVLGCAELKDTYKYQSISIPSPVVLLRGKIDTISVLVKSLYNDEKGYSLSEIKLEGERYY